MTARQREDAHASIPEALTIRPATPADLPRIEQLLVANALPTAGVADAVSGFLIAELNGLLAGVAGVEARGRTGLLRSVAVDSSWRDRGLGRRLVERTIAEATARRMTALYLLTTTAERYFPTFGFIPVTRDAVPASVRDTVEFNGACPASATVMMLNLSEAR